MRKLSQYTRVQATMVPEVLRGLKHVLIQCDDVKVAGRDLQIGTFATTILVHFLDLPEEEQYRIVRAGAARLDGLLAAEERRGPWERPSDDPDPDGGVHDITGRLDVTREGGGPTRQRKKG